MKPSKKAYTTPPKKKTVVRGSIEHKLMQLHNRIDEAQTSEPKHIDREWVWIQVEEVQNGVILGKINIVKAMAEAKDDYSVDFITSVEIYVRKNYRITKKQMAGLNKVYKRLTEDLFDDVKDKTKKQIKDNKNG